MERTLVVGAGLSGLACAFDLVRAGRDVVVLEASRRPGGVVGTVEQDGFRFEDGPNTVLASALELRRLCADLGIAGKLVASSPAAKDRYLYFKRKLRPLPRGPASFLATPLLSPGAKLRLLTEPLRKHRPLPTGAPEPDLARFLAERLGPEAARVLAGSFVRGVYAAELEELGAASAFPRLWAMAEEHGGLVRGALARRRRAQSVDSSGPSFPRGSLLSFERGFVELVDALAAALGPRLRLGARVEAIARAGSGWRVRLAGGEELSGNSVVLAVPAPIAAELLRPLAPAAAVESLARIPHGRVTLVHLGVAASELPRFPSGFGYLVPPGGEDVTGPDPPRALGTIFVSNLFAGRAPDGHVALTSFYRTSDLERGGRSLPRDDVVAVAADDLARAIGSERPPSVRTALVRSWDGVLPRYEPGHARRARELEAALAASLPGLALAGNHVAGVSVEQVIARGRAVAGSLSGDGYRGRV